MFRFLVLSIALSQQTFEVVSIKPVDPNSLSGVVAVNVQPGRIIASNCTLKTLIKLAYGANDRLMEGLPNWADSAAYDVDARINRETADELSTLNEEQRTRAYQQMSQAMLADRFQLKLHRETREMPFYSLVIPKSGHKLHPAKPGEIYANGATTPEGALLGPNTIGFKTDSDWNATITGQAASTEMLTAKIRGWFPREVVDNTALTGKYDFQFTFQWPKGLDPALAIDDMPGASGIDIFTALEKQLGLKLESRKGPVEALVIDHVEKPSPN